MQYTHNASLDCAVHTRTLYTVQYTHSVSLHCAVHTQYLYTIQYTHSASLHCAVHTQCLSTLCSTRTHHGYICCHNTDYVHINGHDRTITVILAKYCIELPDDGSLVIRNMLRSNFKYFKIFYYNSNSIYELHIYASIG